MPFKDGQKRACKKARESYMMVVVALCTAGACARVRACALPTCKRRRTTGVYGSGSLAASLSGGFGGSGAFRGDAEDVTVQDLGVVAALEQ